MITWQIIFWTSLFLILHSYLLFPGLLRLLSINKKPNNRFFAAEELPSVSVVMSVHNEEKILGEKLNSILNSAYPKNKITIYAGSDASTDKTNTILEKLAEKNPSIRPVLFKNRHGKPLVINKIMQKVKDEIVIMTDAKVIFQPTTIKNLVRHFANPDIGAVGGNILNENINRSGISLPEKKFMMREIDMKHREGLIWGASTGLYGALYAIRKENYVPVPKGFAVDDFFITMNVLRHNKQSILDIDAIGYENVPDLLTEEYKRKVRIATGNFRNAGYFTKELLKPFKGANFSYISHKLIRWAGPLLFILFFISALVLASHHYIYLISAYLFTGICFMSLFDYFLSKIGIHIVFLRFIRHFISMNVALLHGFINYIRGITYDVWQPTRRF